MGDGFSIIGEDFDLTEAIKEGVRERVSQVADHLRKKNHHISVYLSKDSSQLFTVRMNMRSGRKSFTSKGTHRDFHIALNRAKDHLVRQVNDRQKKKISMRHRYRRNDLPLQVLQGFEGESSLSAVAGS